MTGRPLSEVLADAIGTYVGDGDGPESGPFAATIEVASLPNGGVLITYSAVTHDGDILHREQSMLVAGPDGRDRLYVAHSESPFVAEFVAAEPGGRSFVQREPFGPYTMETVIDAPGRGRLVYAWRWAPTGDTPVEQSRADARLVTGGRPDA